MEYHYTAAQAISKLGISRSTFFYLVRTGVIRKVSLPLRKQAIYEKAEIDALAEEQEQILLRTHKRRSPITFGLPTPDDMAQVHELWTTSMQLAHGEWAEQAANTACSVNPQTLHVLKDHGTGHIWGAVALSPVSDSGLQKLLANDPGDSAPTFGLAAEDWLSFDTKVRQPVDVCLLGILVRPSLHSTYMAMRVMRAALIFLDWLLDSGVVVRNVYTTVETEKQEYQASRLGFTPLETDCMTDGTPARTSIWRHLEVFHTSSRSLLVQHYRRKYTNLFRRLRRYQKASERADGYTAPHLHGSEPMDADLVESLDRGLVGKP